MRTCPTAATTLPDRRGRSAPHALTVAVVRTEEDIVPRPGITEWKSPQLIGHGTGTRSIVLNSKSCIPGSLHA